jgi:hypothetical protein
VRLRAFDVSRISLPSDFLRVFKEMYMGEQPSGKFLRYERLSRKQFAWHTKTRAMRHPLREYGVRRAEKAAARLRSATGHLPVVYPPEKDIWIWDERSAQAISPMTSRDRRRHDSLASHMRIAAATISSAWPIFMAYKTLSARSYRDRVEMKDRVGVAVSPQPETLEREIALLEKLGKVPVIIRFYRHEGQARWDFCAETGRRLAGMGHAVSVALVQDRKAILNPAEWTRFADHVVGAVAKYVDWVEIGHAINRSKWGIWSLDDHCTLMKATVPVREKHPWLRFMGPAGIDFEYPFPVAALKNAPRGMSFNAFSNHLYVDRRGAPENFQGLFSAREKFILGRAIAEWAPHCKGRFIVSEVNWPIAGTGVYSPVGSPYESPGLRRNNPSVSETVYSDFMLRYLVIALCSGMVERVYWWRLVARGFGLVDDTDWRNPRERPAYAALRHFIALLGGAVFERKLDSGEGAELYAFSLPGGENAVFAYSPMGPRRVAMPFRYSHALDSLGNPFAASGGPVELSGSPVYLLGASFPGC